MDEQLIQRSRYILKTRIRTAKTCPPFLFPSACLHLLNWINSHPIFSGSIEKLKKVDTKSKDTLELIISALEKEKDLYEVELYEAEETLQHSAICYHVCNAISRLTAFEQEPASYGISYISLLLTGKHQREVEEAIAPIRDVAIDGLYEYLDEQLDGRNLLYGLLIKYKRRSEWFRRSRLREIVNKGLEGKTGERALAVDLQEYIYDQGVEFYIEPASSSGEVDLVLKASEGNSIIIDAKYIKENSSRSDIQKRLSDGLHQVMRYCEDFNESAGYLVIFTNSDTRIGIESEQTDGIKYLKLGSSIVYYIFVNIYNDVSASKSGKANEIIFNREELVREGA